MADLPLQRLLRDLRRRKVFRVAAVYAVVAWALIEVADVLGPALLLPDWITRAVAFLLILGFPVALLLAWAFDLTPEGVKRTEGAADGAGSGPAPRPPRWAGLAGGLGLAGVLGALAFLGYTQLRPAPLVSDTTELSIAVLPFADMSPAKDQEYFSDGITEDILTKLARIPELRVISRTSVMQYKGTDKSLPEIAKELGVAYVLEGSVRKAEEQVRITAQLIRAASDEHLWAESYDRELRDVFRLQSEIAGAIADALELRLSARDRSRVAKSGTGSIDAYELYLKGREHFHRPYRSTAEVRDHASAAIALFRQALELDPEYALAYAGLARAHRWHPDFSARESYDSAVAFARRAIELDPELPQGYVELGSAYRLRGEHAAALEQFRYAVELNPNDADAITAIADAHERMGRLDEALREYKSAIEIEPTVGERYVQVADIYVEFRVFDLAEEWLRRGLVDVMGHPARAHCHIAEVDLVRGDTEGARAHLRELLRLETGPFAYNCATHVSQRLGDFVEADRYARNALEIEESLSSPQLARAYVALRNGSPDAPERIDRAEAAVLEDARITGGREQRLAAIAMMRGDRDAAIQLLEASYQAGFRNRDELRLQPWFDKLRDDPAFQRLLSRMDADLGRMRARVQREGW